MFTSSKPCIWYISTSSTGGFRCASRTPTSRTHQSTGQTTTSSTRAGRRAPTESGPRATAEPLPLSRSANACRSTLSRSFRSTISHTTLSPAMIRGPSTGYVPVLEASSTVGYVFRPGIRTPSTSTVSTVRRQRKSTSLQTMSSISPSPCASTHRINRTLQSTGPTTTASTSGGRRSPTRFGCLCQNLL